MLHIDHALLAEVGLGELPPAEANTLLHHLLETLQLRVGKLLAERMSEAQLNQFEVFMDTGNEAGALLWLDRNLPGYRDVARDQFEVLREELRASAGTILAASRDRAAA